MQLFKNCTAQDLRQEAKAVLWVSWPIIVTMLLHLLTSSTSIIFCGHLGKEIMDAVSLVSMVINVFGFGTTMGLASACDTLFAQSYGSSNKENMGVILQRGCIILLLMCLPSIAIFITAEHLLILAGQDAGIAKNAARYTKIFIAGLPGMALSQVLRRFVYVQGIITPQIVMMVLANVVNVACHAVFLFALNMEITGAAISMCITNWFIAVSFAIYIVVWKCHNGLWKGMSVECLEDWGEFFGLAVPGMLMLQMEWFSEEIITFICGLIGRVELAA